MIKTKGFLISLSFLTLAFFPNIAQAQAVRNVISSCRVLTTAGIVESGKCKIKTWLQNDYIIVEVKKSWEEELSYFRLTNNPQCKNWGPTMDDNNPCKAVTGDGQSWDEESIVVSIGEYIEENSNPKFGYSFGRAYTLIYDGSFVIPE
ncbi:hypothetical protein [Nostoc sp. FACHB-145]|uniref:hypothetical protein n=1 Tax=Nostoc sp. FACHB-145 TaxID=2692836 RepID=UPI0016861054|nr:hypothetical protein [Nostoc sp. FACHB-145]MBD2471561.1 hypothetical protein [Nostoc sp. FACHB-145]